MTQIQTILIKVKYNKQNHPREAMGKTNWEGGCNKTLPFKKMSFKDFEGNVTQGNLICDWEYLVSAETEPTITTKIKEYKCSQHNYTTSNSLWIIYNFWLVFNALSNVIYGITKI